MVRTSKFLGTAAVAFGICVCLANARDAAFPTKRIEQGISITVRTSETVPVQQAENRLYRGIVDRDVRDDAGRVVIPRGSGVELISKVAADGSFDLGLATVIIDGDRYVVKADPERTLARQDDSLARAIVGSLHGSRAELPAGSAVTFRLDRPMVIAVPDPGEPAVRNLSRG
jgi:hypothetical protein